MVDMENDTTNGQREIKADGIYGQSETISDDKIIEPFHYRVLLHNDDFTTKDFVVNILRGVFNKDFEDAYALMETVDKTGIGVCGVYTEEVAETKVHMVIHLARMSGFPLRCTMEKV